MRNISKQVGIREELRRGWYLGAAALRSVVDLGPGTTRLAVTNTFSQGAASAIRKVTGARRVATEGIGELLGYEAVANGAVFRFKDAMLEVLAMGDHVVRITWEPGNLPVPYSLRDGWPPPARKDAKVFLEGNIDSFYILRYNNYIVRIHPTGAVQFSIDHSVLSDQSIGGRSSDVAPAPDSFSTDPDKATETLICYDLPPRRVGKQWSIDRKYRSKSLVCGLGEKAGRVDLSGRVIHSRRAQGRGRSYRLWNRDPGGLWGPGVDPLYMSIPFVISIDPEQPDTVVGCFYENSWESSFSFPVTSDNLMNATFEGGALRYYLMAGNLGEVLKHYTDITGRAPLPPRWALGYHQSRWGYKTEDDVRDVADNFKRMNIPLSAIHLDIDYMDGYKVFTIDSSRFPDMKALTDGLAEQGIRIVTILDPAVKAVHLADHGLAGNDPTNIAGDGAPDHDHDITSTSASHGAGSSIQYDLYEDGIFGGHFCKNAQGEVQLGVVWPGRAAFPDFTNPSTRKWWEDKYKFFTSNGIAGVWHDMNEPTNIALLGDKTLPLDTIHSMDGRGGKHEEAHNLYALEMNRSGYAGLLKASPDKRPFILSRSGWAGSQRYAWGWTGDTESTWEALRQQIPTMIGLGLSGFPFSGPDIGGFNGAPSEELYLRWLQLSTFLPFCRTHSVAGVPLREPWKLPESIRLYVAYYIRLRYRLLPYLYTLAHTATTSGIPLVRPLGWSGHDDGSDPLLWKIDDAFMLGESMLVAPMTAPGRTSRLIRLPKGTWSSWPGSCCSSVFNNSVEDVQSESIQLRMHRLGFPGQLNGGRVVRLPAPLEDIPVLVRHGSILPLDDGWPQSQTQYPSTSGRAKLLPDDGRLDTPGDMLDLEHRPKMLSFHIWPDEKGFGRGTCYDDCGDGYGESRMDDITFSREGDIATLTWTKQGSYPAPDKVRVVLHGVSATRCYVDGNQVDIDAPQAPYQSFSVTCPSFSAMRLEIASLQ